MNSFKKILSLFIVATLSFGAPTILKGLDTKEQTTIPFLEEEEEALNPCLICHYDCCNSDEPVRMLECGHTYHVSCINKWLKNNDCCPLRCKKKVTPKFKKEMIAIQKNFELARKLQDEINEEQDQEKKDQIKKDLEYAKKLDQELNNEQPIKKKPKEKFKKKPKKKKPLRKQQTKKTNNNSHKQQDFISCDKLIGAGLKAIIDLFRFLTTP